MSVNIFGNGPITASTGTIVNQRGPPGLGFKYLDEERNFDIENKRIANVASPIEENDVTTKIYIDDKIISITNKLDDLGEQNINEVNLLKGEDIMLKNHIANLEEKVIEIENLNKVLFDLNDKILVLSNHYKINHMYDTIIFQTNSKLEQGKFLFSLGMKGPASKKSGYVMPYDGSIDRIVMSSQDVDKKICVKLWINGNEFDRDDFVKPENEYFHIHQYTEIALKEGDIVQFQATCNTENEKSMHVIQMMLRYDMIKSVNEENMLKDEPNNVEWDLIDSTKNKGKLSDMLRYDMINSVDEEKMLKDEPNNMEWKDSNEGKLSDISNLINNNLHD